MVCTYLHPPSTRRYLSFFVSRLILDAASFMDTENGRNKKRLHQLASLIVFRSTTPAGALQTRSRCCDCPIPATRCCVVVERASWRRQPTPRQQPSFFPSLQLFLPRYGTLPTYLLYSRSTAAVHTNSTYQPVNSLQKNLVPRNLQPCPNKKTTP